MCDIFAFLKSSVIFSDISDVSPNVKPINMLEISFGNILSDFCFNFLYNSMLLASIYSDGFFISFLIFFIFVAFKFPTTFLVFKYNL